jgi:predicted transcriptional regulator with HTH domain
MCDNLHLNSLKQCQTPLNTLFFSSFNVNLLQRAIRQDFKNKTGISIDYQSEDDLYGIMRVVFINNSGDHNVRVNEQVKMMNEMVIKTAVSQIQSGVSQYMGYVHDMDRGLEPLDRPQSTTTYGNKIGKSDKIGI